MNCQEFESRIDTLARGALADARQLTEASAHEESCAPCAARLADERALSTGLRALASGMKDVETPARVETALLAAFRARAVSEGDKDLSRTDVAANVVPLVPRVEVRPWSWVKTAAVASLAAAASLALFVLVRPDAEVNAPGSRVNQSAMIEPPPGALGDETKPQVAKVSSAGRRRTHDGSARRSHGQTRSSHVRAAPARHECLLQHGWRAPVRRATHGRLARSGDSHRVHPARAVRAD